MLTHALTTCSRGNDEDEDEDSNKRQVETTSGGPRSANWHHCSQGLVTCSRMADLVIQVLELTVTSGELDQPKDIGNEKSLV